MQVQVTKHYIRTKYENYVMDMEDGYLYKKVLNKYIKIKPSCKRGYNLLIKGKQRLLTFTNLSTLTQLTPGNEKPACVCVKRKNREAVHTTVASYS